MVHVRGAKCLQYGYNIAHDRAMFGIKDADSPNSSYTLWLCNDGKLRLDITADGKTTTYTYAAIK